MSALRKKQNTALTAAQAPPLAPSMNTPVQPTQVAQPMQAAVEPTAATNNVGYTNSSAAKMHTRRVMVECNATMAELMSGKLINIPNSADIFKPNCNMSDPEVVKTMSNLDMSKGIIHSIDCTSMYNSSGEAVTVSLNLFRTPEGKAVEESSVTNSCGWVHTAAATDFGAVARHSDEGFTNVLCLTPYEKTRQEVRVYHPDNVVNNRYIEQYGGYTLKSLWNGIVPFPNEPYYYVEKDHIILRVIEQNWEMLGINTANESMRENKYVKVASSVVDKVIDELYKSVLCRIPFTSFNDLQAKFACNRNELGEMDEPVKIMTEFKIQYTYPSINTSTDDAMQTN